MGFDFSLLNVCFQMTLFTLFAVKAYGGIKNYIIPFLKSYQQEQNEKWFTLQERHAVLISKKKQLATQFLQQEKQIALLSAKLETWYEAWKSKQKEKALRFEEQAQKIASLQTTQERNIAQSRAAARNGKQILKKVVSSLKQQKTIQHAFVERGIDLLKANREQDS